MPIIVVVLTAVVMLIALAPIVYVMASWDGSNEDNDEL